MRVVASLIALLAFSVGCQSASPDETSDEASTASALETSLSIAANVGERVEKNLFVGPEQAQVPPGATCRAAHEKVPVAIGRLKLANPTAKAAAVSVKRKSGDQRPIQLRYYASAPQPEKLEDCASTALNELSRATQAQVVVPPNGEVVIVGYFVSDGDYPLQKTGSIPLEITTDALDDDASVGLLLAVNVGERVSRSVFVGPSQSQIPLSSSCRPGGEKVATTVGIVKLVNPTMSVASVSMKKSSRDDGRLQLRVYAAAPQPDKLDDCLASAANELSKANDTQVVVPPNGEAYVVAHFITGGDYPSQGTGAIPLEVVTDSLD